MNWKKTLEKVDRASVQARKLYDRNEFCDATYCVRMYTALSLAILCYHDILEHNFLTLAGNDSSRSTWRLG
jgi:hypothetical protein